MNTTRKLFFSIVIIIPYASFGMESATKSIVERKPTVPASKYHEYSLSQFESGKQLIGLLSLRKKNAIVYVPACRTGQLAEEIAKMVPDGIVAASDVAEEYVAFAQQQCTVKNLFFSKQSVLDMQGKEICDAIVYNAALHYVPRTEQPTVMKKFAQALKYDGTVLIRSPQRDGDAPYTKALFTTLGTEKWLTKILASNPELRKRLPEGSEDCQALLKNPEALKKMLEQSDGAVTLDEMKELLDGADLEGTVEVYTHRHEFDDEKSFIDFVRGWLSGYDIFTNLSEEYQKAFIKAVNARYFEATEMSPDKPEYIIPLITAKAGKKLDLDSLFGY